MRLTEKRKSYVFFVGSREDAWACSEVVSGAEIQLSFDDRVMYALKK